MGTSSSRPATEAARKFAENAIATNKVAVFSKTYCPYCHKAKAALNTVLAPNQYTVFELDKMEDGDAIQSALADITGGRTVPRVFIGGRFIGGGDDTAAKAANGQLKQLLAGAGL